MHHSLYLMELLVEIDDFYCSLKSKSLNNHLHKNLNVREWLNLYISTFALSNDTILPTIMKCPLLMFGWCLPRTYMIVYINI